MPDQSWELKQLTEQDLDAITELCQPFGAEGSVTLPRALAIALVDEVRQQRKRDHARREAGEGVIRIESIVSRRNGRPYVKLAYGSVEVQLSADETIAHARRLIEVAAGSWADAFLAAFVRDRLKVGDPILAGHILADFREHRETNREAPAEDEGA